MSPALSVRPSSLGRASFPAPRCKRFWGALLLLLLLPAQRAFAETPDPLEPMNRGIFWFNDKFDVYILEPVAKGFDAVVPDRAKRSIRNFFRNLGTPVLLASDLIQLKFNQAGVHTGRFLINTSLGGLGLFDVADEFGYEYHDEDLGTAMGYHGVGGGFYIVIPLLGASNARDLVGFIGGIFLDPLHWVGTEVDPEGPYIDGGLTGLNAVATRARLLDAVRGGKEASLDYYLFVRSSYYQHRQNLIYDGNPPDEYEEEEEEEAEESAAADSDESDAAASAAAPEGSDQEGAVHREDSEAGVAPAPLGN